MEKTPHVGTFGRLLRLLQSEFIYEDASLYNDKVEGAAMFYHGCWNLPSDGSCMLNRQHLNNTTS